MPHTTAPSALHFDAPDPAKLHVRRSILATMRATIRAAHGGCTDPDCPIGAIMNAPASEERDDLTLFLAVIGAEDPVAVGAFRLLGLDVSARVRHDVTGFLLDAYLATFDEEERERVLDRADAAAVAHFPALSEARARASTPNPAAN